MGRGIWIERHDRRGVRHLANSRLDRRHDHPAGTAHTAVCVARRWRDQAHPTGRHEARSRRKCWPAALQCYRRCSSRSRSTRCGRHAGHCVSAFSTICSVGVSAKICATRRVVRMQARFSVDRAQAQRVSALAAQFHSALNTAASDEMANRLRWAASAARGRVCDFAQRLSQALGVSDSAQRHCWLFDIGPGTRRDPGARAAGQPEKGASSARRSRERRQHSVVATGRDTRTCAARSGVARTGQSSSGKTIELALASDWLTRHPLTQYLLEEEATHWERVGVAFALRPAVAACLHQVRIDHRAQYRFFTVRCCSRWLSHHSPPFFSDHSSA